MTLTGVHDTYLVILSIIIAIAASFTALSLANRVQASSDRTRLLWLFAAPTALGGGIWGRRAGRSELRIQHKGIRATAIIRDFAKPDLDALYRVALATADNGADASHLYCDPKLPGHLYAAPYALFAPELALVLEDELGVGGYIVGALDTRAFEQLLEERWWPALRASQPGMGDDLTGVTGGDDSYAWRTIHHPPTGTDWLVKHHPSHLHINLLPRLQGGGHGGRLLQAWIARVRALGSTGFHLGVSPANARAIHFYQRQGLTRLSPADGSEDGATWFGANLSADKRSSGAGSR